MTNHYNEKYPNCFQTASGIMFNLLDPKPEMFNIQDIAQCLSRIPHWNGSTKQFISVAEHSILVSKYLPQEYQFTGLMHDCAEAYIGDISRPLKKLLIDFADSFSELNSIEIIESNILFQASKVFGLEYPLPEIVKQVDTQICETERVLLMPPGDWNFGCDPIPDISIHCWEPREAYIQFMCRFYNLMKGYKNAKN